MASGERDAPKTFAGSGQLHGHAQRQTSVEKKKVFAFAHRHLFYIFSFTARKSFCHALRARTCPIIFFPCGAMAETLTQTKSACTRGHTFFVLRGSGMCGHLFFVRAFSPPAFPRNPHAGRRGRGCLRARRLTQEYCLRQRIAYAGVGLHALAAPWKRSAFNEVQWLACIIFLKRKCARSLV